MQNYKVMTVSEITSYMVRVIQRDINLNNVVVRGEISNFKYSGPHAYFSLVGDDSLLNCVMFNAAYKLHGRKIADGTMAKALGSVRIYAKRGAYQLYAEAIKEGTDYGELYKKLEELKAALKEEGVFDADKKPIPPVPKRIAVVSSKTSAAFRDVVNTVKKRYPIAELLLFHTGVQGKEAIDETVAALDLADRSDADVVLLVRGGGSMEDLWNFNEEKIVRKVHAMKKPVISGVGHETDTTLVDYVSDMRAPTPTGAAERATPDLSVLSGNVGLSFRRMANLLKAKTSFASDRLSASKRRLGSLSPSRLLLMRREMTEDRAGRMRKSVLKTLDRKNGFLSKSASALTHSNVVRTIDLAPGVLDSRMETMVRIIRAYIDRKKSVLDVMNSEMKSYDPRMPLEKGYAMVFKDGRIVRSSAGLDKEDGIDVVFADGRVVSKVEEVYDGKGQKRK